MPRRPNTRTRQAKGNTTVISSIVSMLPILVRIFGWILDRSAASEKTKKVMRELISSLKDDGLISDENSEKMKSHRERIKDQIEADNKNGEA